MGYDKDLADRIRELLPEAEPKAMFGGLAFLIGGHMAIAASREGGLMVRVAPEDTDQLLGKPHARPFEMRGKQLAGWLRVDAAGVATKRQLKAWIDRGADHARSLPSKS